jgi:hypothetical protein
MLSIEDKVNKVVGRPVLLPYSDPSKYRFTKEAYPLVRDKVKKSDDE